MHCHELLTCLLQTYMNILEIALLFLLLKELVENLEILHFLSMQLVTSIVCDISYTRLD